MFLKMVTIGVLFAAVWMGVSAQPIPQGSGGGNGSSPRIAPFGRLGPQRGMEGAPPVLLDVNELKIQLEEIGIEKSVIEKITAISYEFVGKFEGLLIKVHREELNIREELLKEKPDLKNIQKFIKEKTGYFSEIEYLQIKRDLAIKELLTQDEYGQLKSATMKKMREMLPPGMQHGPEGGSHERMIPNAK